MTETKELTPEEEREIGKRLYFHACASEDNRKVGLSYLVHASNRSDPEAMYYVASFILSGLLTISNPKNPTEHALWLLCRSSAKGCIMARALLNKYCNEHYKQRFSYFQEKSNKRLTGFNGKPIKINRRGLFTPVDVHLYYDEELRVNILQIDVNVNFLHLDNSMEDVCAFEKAVIDGIKLWNGHYEVFGGQSVMVCVDVTKNEKSFDAVSVVPVGEYLSNFFKEFADKMPTNETKDQFHQIITDKRSFANLLFGWSVHSRKIIYMQSENGKFNSYDEIMHTAKHEFGHCLGLGDLYQEQEAGLPGVPIGSYPELDCYAVTDRFYHAVMCDHFGPVTNNDIEMVILAFSKNKFQHFQSKKIKKISEALGKGN